VGLSATALLLAGLAFAAEGAAPQEKPLTLDECIREALIHNPQLNAAAARSQALDHAADAVRASRWPRIDLSLDYSYADRPQRLMQPSFQGEVLLYDSDIAQAMAEVRVPLFAGGRLVARQRAAELAAAAGRCHLQGSRQDLVLNVTAAYLAASQQQSVIDSMDASLQALREGQKVMATMLEVGRSAPLELLKVEVRVAAIEQRLSKAIRDRELIALHLGVLLGRDGPSVLPRVAGLPALPLPEKGEVAAWVDQAANARAEVKAAQKDTARRQSELDLVRGERWPSLDAFARWTGRSTVPAQNVGIPSAQDFLAAGLTVRLPLWTGGELTARERQARALLKEAQARERAEILSVREQAQREAAALAEASGRAMVGEKAVAQAREAFAIERSNFELGRAAVNDILDAQAALLDAELALAQARHDEAYAAIALAWAAGSDLEKRVMESK